MIAITSWIQMPFASAMSTHFCTPCMYRQRSKKVEIHTQCLQRGIHVLGPTALCLQLLPVRKSTHTLCEVQTATTYLGYTGSSNFPTPAEFSLARKLQCC